MLSSSEATREGKMFLYRPNKVATNPSTSVGQLKKYYKEPGVSENNLHHTHFFSRQSEWC